MEIIKETPQRPRGRKPKYKFYEMQPGDCMKIPAKNMREYRNIMSALAGHKERHGSSWKTTTRFDNNIVSVYRLS